MHSLLSSLSSSHPASLRAAQSVERGNQVSTLKKSCSSQIMGQPLIWKQITQKAQVPAL